MNVRFMYENNKVNAMSDKWFEDDNSSYLQSVNKEWRVGSKYEIHIYAEGDVPIGTALNPYFANTIVIDHNKVLKGTKESTEVKQKPPLTFETPDSLGKVPPLNLKGKQYRHTGNNKIYMLLNFCWCGESDRWCFIMQERYNPTTVFVHRPLEHLNGSRSDGQPRYIKVHDND